MYNTAKILIAAYLFVTMTTLSNAHAHETKAHVAKPTSIEKAFNCEVKANACAIAMIKNKTGKIKLANVSNALKRQKAQTSTSLALITTFLEKEFIKGNSVQWNNDNLPIETLNLNEHLGYFSQTAKQLGAKAIEKYLGHLRFGDKKLYNNQRGFDPDALLISAVEQVKFLRRVIENRQVTQKNTKQKLESLFRKDQSTQLHYLVFSPLQIKNAPDISAKGSNEADKSKWIIGWYDGATDRAYFAFHQKNADMSQHTQLASIKQWIEN